MTMDVITFACPNLSKTKLIEGTPINYSYSYRWLCRVYPITHAHSVGRWRMFSLWNDVIHIPLCVRITSQKYAVNINEVTMTGMSKTGRYQTTIWYNTWTVYIIPGVYCHHAASMYSDSPVALELLNSVSNYSFVIQCGHSIWCLYICMILSQLKRREADRHENCGLF